MSAILQSPVLVLNKSWAPVNTVTLENAITKVWNDKARIVEYPSYQTFSWDDWSKLKAESTDNAIKSVNMYFRIPEIILLTEFDRMPMKKTHFSRRNLYKRDNYTCQYCTKKFASTELTIDHVMPSSRGGKSTWENCVLACVDCNSRKANRTPEEARMKLLREPKMPKMALFRIDHLKKIESWEAFLGAAYWNVDISGD